MKNKKSKIVVPALALILLSTAASISGSVAWFTASRTANVKTGNFAVVNTGDNLDVALVGIAGIKTPEEHSYTLNQKEDLSHNVYALTDASFDHTNTISPYVVEPDIPRASVLKTTNLSAATPGITTTDGFSSFNLDGSLEANLNRGTNVYSAFVWNMTFSVKFSDAAIYNQGLFLDLTKSYMHEAVTIKEVGESLANLYESPDLSGNVKTGLATADDLDKTYYKAIPDDTGKGFRIAFIPTGVTASTSSKGYARVWAANENGVTDEGKYVSGHAYIPAVVEEEVEVSPAVPATTLAPGAQYSTSNKTLVFDGVSNGDGTFFDYETSAGAYLNGGDSTLGVPTDNSLTDAEAFAGKKNYLGKFGVSAGNTVKLQFTCVAWYEGTNPNVDEEHVLEAITTSLQFGVCNLNS